MAEAVGQIRVEASIGTAKYVAGARQIKAETASLERDIKTRFTGIGAAVKGGIAGLVGALSVGAFVQIGRAALDYASKLGDVSQQLGLTTRDLQTFRYAAGQLGVSQSELEKGLENLTKTLGKVAVGAEKPAKALEAIGLNAQAVARMDTGDAFRAISDALAKVTDRAQRAAVETALFGETGARLDTMLAGGSAALNELAAAADELGIVLSDEQIQKADETADKLEALKTVLQARIAGIVADNADSILGLADAIQVLVKTLGDAIGYLNAFRSALAGLEAGRNSIFEQLLGRTVGGEPVQRSGQQRFGGLFKGRPAAPRGVDVGDFLARTPRSGGGRRRSGRTPRDDSARDLHRFEQDELRAQIDILRAKQQLATDYVDRTSIGVQILDLERDVFANDLRFQVSQKDLTQTQADRLLLLHADKDALERQALLREEEEQRQREFARLEDIDLDIQRQALEAQLVLADTVKDRRDLELRLLNIAHQEEQLAIDRLAASKEWADQEEARRRQGALNARVGADRQAVFNANRTPMEQWSDQFRDINDELEQLQVQGIMGAVDAMTQLTDGFTNFRDAAQQAIRAVLQELIRLQLMKLAVNLFGAATGTPTGGFSLAPAGMGGIYPGLATGGYVVGSGTSTSDSIPAMLSNGEFVMNARAVRKFGTPLLEEMNSGKPPSGGKGGGLGFLKYMSPAAMALSGDGGFLKFLSPGAFLASKIFGFKDGGLVGRGLSLPQVSYRDRIGIGHDGGGPSRGGITVHAPITIQGNATRQTTLQLEGAMRRGVGRAMKAFG